MRVNNTIAQLLVWSFLLNPIAPAVALADGPAPAQLTLTEKSAVLKDLVDNFEKVCLDKDGNILKGVAVVDAQTLGDDSRPVVCEEEAARLAHMIEALETETTASPGGTNADCPECQKAAQADAGHPDPQLAALSGSIAKLAEENSCKQDEKTELLSMQCFKDAACASVGNNIDMVYKAVMGYASVVKIQPGWDKGTLTGCTGKYDSRSSCLTEAVTGLVKDLWSNVTAIWDLAKLAGKGIYHGVKKAGKWVGKKVVAGWDWVRGVEDKTSEAMLAASQQEPGMIDLFKKDPGGFLKNMVKGLFDMIWTESKKTFGCAKWEGAPHFSKCVKEMDNWDCATCDQKLDVVCGMIGFIGGEVLVAYLSGGTVSAGKAAVKGGAVAVTKIAEIAKAIEPVAAAIEKGAVVMDKVAVVGKVAMKGVEAAADALKAIKASRAGVKIIEYGKVAGKAIGEAASKAAMLKPVKITLKVLSGVTYPARKYLELLDKAFKAGMVGGDRAIAGIAEAAALSKLEKANTAATAAKTDLEAAQKAAEAAKGTDKAAEADKALKNAKKAAAAADKVAADAAKAAEAAKAAKAAAGGGAATAQAAKIETDALDNVKDYHVVLSDEQAGGKGGQVLADVEKNLQADGVKYKEVTTPEGQKALEVELPPSCPGGKVTLSVGPK